VITLTNNKQDNVRDWLVKVTDVIPSESVAGAVFGVLLVVSDHYFNLKG
jgi:hypothetical protein